MEAARRATALVLAVIVGGVLLWAVSGLPEFGSFPQRQVGGETETAVGEQYLLDAPTLTGATNVVTSVVWGYRGYDTLGESTVLFTAVVGVIMLFRAVGREE